MRSRADRVDSSRGHAGTHRAARGRLGAPQHRVVLEEIGRRLADDVGAGGVGAVALSGRAADVDHHRVAGLDDPIGHLVVRAGPVGAGADDDEVGPLVALGDDRLGDVPADLALGAPGRATPRIRACTPSMAAPARRSASTSAGVLRIRSSQHAPRPASAGLRERVPGSAKHLLGPHPVVDADAAHRPPAPAASAYGSSVSGQPTISMPAAGREAAGRSSAGTTRNGSPSAGTTRQVSRSRGRAW